MSTEVRKGYSQNARRILSSFCLCGIEDFDIIDEDNRKVSGVP